METRQQTNRTDILVLLGCVAFYALLEWWIAPRGTMTEGDPYRMLFGILNGKANGFGLLDVMHYGSSFSFGYLAFVYHFAGESALTHPAQLIDFMNHLSYVSAVATVLLLWLCVREAYGPVIAGPATILFALSPIFIQLGTEGHPILPAYMFLMAGTTLIFKEGRWYVTLAGLLILLAGITIRADILFIFPWIALTHKSADSWKEYARKVAVRLALLLPLFPLFLFVRHMVLSGAQVDSGATSTGQSLSSYMGEFFTVANIMGGCMTAVLACGIATSLMLAAVALLQLWRGSPDFKTCTVLAGPVAMMVMVLFFWIPIGINARHFVTFTLGASLIIPLFFVVMLRTGSTAVLCIALALAAGNQLASEAARPQVFLHYRSFYLNIPDTERTLTMAPIGFTWTHMKTIEQRHRIYQKWIDDVVKDACDKRVVVMMDYENAEQGMSSMFGEGMVPESHLLAKGVFKRVIAIKKGDQTFIFVSKADAWPKDPLAEILARRDLTDAMVLVDPYSLSIYDRAQLPSYRAPHFGCKSAAPR